MTDSNSPAVADFVANRMHFARKERQSQIVIPMTYRGERFANVRGNVEIDYSARKYSAHVWKLSNGKPERIEICAPSTKKAFCAWAAVAAVDIDSNVASTTHRLF